MPIVLVTSDLVQCPRQIRREWPPCRPRKKRELGATPEQVTIEEEGGEEIQFFFWRRPMFRGEKSITTAYPPPPGSCYPTTSVGPGGGGAQLGRTPGGTQLGNSADARGRPTSFGRLSTHGKDDQQRSVPAVAWGGSGPPAPRGAGERGAAERPTAAGGECLAGGLCGWMG